jgi:hypothetical protein
MALSRPKHGFDSRWSYSLNHDNSLEECMNQFIKRMAVCVSAGVLMAGMALAQAPAAAPAQGGGAPPAGGAPGGGGGGRAGGGGGGGRAPQAPIASPNPIYMSTRMEADVNKPAAEAWARVGKFCDIGEWAGFNCTILSGKDGELGVVRSIANEIMVAKTDLSYTYAQPVRTGAFYDAYHGTVELKPVTATTSKIVYTLMWDASNLADDAAREADKTRRTTQFQGFVNNMKILAEGGTLPARGGGGGRGGGAPGGGRGQQQ